MRRHEFRTVNSEYEYRLIERIYRTMQSRGEIKCVERRSLSTSVYDNVQVDFSLLNLKAVAGTSYANDVQRVLDEHTRTTYVVRRTPLVVGGR